MEVNQRTDTLIISRKDWATYGFTAQQQYHYLSLRIDTEVVWLFQGP